MYGMSTNRKSESWSASLFSTVLIEGNYDELESRDYCSYFTDQK
jgi:hypothetical protein